MNATSIVEEIKRLEAARAKAIVAIDLAGLDQLLAPDLIYTHSSGVSEGKSAFIARVQTRLYRRLEPKEVVIRVHGGTAVVSGLIEIDTEASGTRKSLKARFVNVWVQNQALWQNTLWQATIAPD